MHRQPRHLHEIAIGRLRHIGLPVGIGDEAHRCVEGEMRTDIGKMLRIEWQKRLSPLQQIKNDKAREAENQHGDCVGGPVLFVVLAHAANAVDDALQRFQKRRQQRALSVEHACHIAAERFRQRYDDGAEERDLQPAVRRPWHDPQKRSGRTSA